MDRPDLAEAGVAAVQSAFEELCQTPVAPAGPLEFGPDAVAATIALKRNPPGTLTLAFPAAVLEALAGRYLPAEPLSAELLNDTAGEFANVVAGQIKTMLKGTPDHFELSTPQVRPSVKPHPAATLLPFECDAGGFTLELFLPPA